MALVHAELTWQFSTPCQSPKYRLIDFKFLWMITFRGTRTLLSFVFVGKPVAAPGGGDIYGSCDFFFFFFFFCFSGSRPVETRGPILAHNSLKYAVWCKEVPFGVYNCNFTFLGGVLPQKYPKTASEWGFPNQNEKVE